MTNLHRVLFFLLLTSLLGCSGAPEAQWGRGHVHVPAAGSGVTKQEHDMFARLNQDRAKKGLHALRYDEKLADIGRAHSADMNRHQFFAHESPRTGSAMDRVVRAAYAAIVARENLALHQNIAAAQDALLKSPGHYANIMANDITHVGIGIVASSHDTRQIYITQVFAKPAAIATPEQLQRDMIARIPSTRAARSLPPLPIHDGLQAQAQSHVGKIHDKMSKGDFNNLGQKIIATFSSLGGGLRSLGMSGQLAFGAADVPIPQAALRKEAAAVAVATQAARGEGGRPVVKVLILIGIK